MKLLIAASCGVQEMKQPLHFCTESKSFLVLNPEGNKAHPGGLSGNFFHCSAALREAECNECLTRALVQLSERCIWTPDPDISTPLLTLLIPERDYSRDHHGSRSVVPYVFYHLLCLGDVVSKLGDGCVCSHLVLFFKNFCVIDVRGRRARLRY